MPFPGDWDLVEVRGEYIGTDGLPMSGRVIYTPAVKRVIDSTVTVILIGKPRVATLDNQGKFVIEMPATDDPDINPSGFTYQVKEDFTGGGGDTYYIEVPISALFDGVEMAALSPVDWDGGTPVVRGPKGDPAEPVAPLVNALVPGLVADELDSHVPGSVMYYGEITYAFIATTVNPTSTPVSALLATVTGSGRPVEVKLEVDSAYHSVTGQGVVLGVAFQRAGVYQGFLGAITVYSPKNTAGICSSLSRQKTLDAGVEYAFYPVVAGTAAGNAVLANSGGLTLTKFSVVSR